MGGLEVGLRIVSAITRDKAKKIARGKLRKRLFIEPGSAERWEDDAKYDVCRIHRSALIVVAFTGNTLR
jgi:hypothetical protein